MYWGSTVPFKYKWNAITGELHRAKRVALDFDKIIIIIIIIIITIIIVIRRIKVNTWMLDTHMLLKTLSRILTERKRRPYNIFVVIW